MKKVLAIALAVMLVPFTAFGLEMLEDSAMDNVTGQAGVSINLDAHVDLTIDTVSWGDADGVGGTSTAGYVGISGLDMDDLYVTARTDAGLYPIYATYAYLDAQVSGYTGDTNSTEYATLVAYRDAALANWAATGYSSPVDELHHNSEFLTIDVASNTTSYGGATFVRIGLGTISITMDQMVADVKLGDDADLYNDADAQTLGSIYISDMEVLTSAIDATSGELDIAYVDIYAEDGEGVNINMDVILDSVSMGVMAWGDDNGVDTTTALGSPYGSAGGYVGLNNLFIDNLEVNGETTIDVATDSVQYGGATFVRLGFNEMEVGFASMTADVALGAHDTIETVGLDQTLGTMYMSNMSATIDTGSYVDIYGRTGEQGVNIYMDITMDVTMDDVAWGDADGFDGSDGGYVGLADLNVQDMAVNGEVTIDVATDTSTYGGSTFVHLGFNDLTVGFASMTATAALGSYDDISTNGLDEVMGHVYAQGMAFTMANSSYVDIYADAGDQGVNIYADIVDATVDMDVMSWGDTDGVDTITGAGYAGMTNLAIADLDINGLVSIDVATATAADAYDEGLSFVEIYFGVDALDPLTVHMGSMAANVAMGAAQDLSLGTGTYQTLGSVYVGNMNADVYGWIHIAAH